MKNRLDSTKTMDLKNPIELPMRRFLLSIGLLVCGLALSSSAQTQAQLVVLGSGTPILDPDRSGPALAILVNGFAYLIDFGPGVVRRASLASEQHHLDALQPSHLKIAFVTHLHSDHTAGLADLFLSPAVEGRGAPLELFGPPGLADMAKHIRAAYSKDIQLRINGLEHGDARAYEMNVHEIKEGVVFQDKNVVVTAFAVPHGSWDYAYGYRFDAPGKSIVISGDTGPSDAVARACHGCDLLLHEVYSVAWFQQKPQARQKYHAAFHTSSTELARIAAIAKPKKLVLYHQLFSRGEDPAKVLIEEMRSAGYVGAVVSANDLDIF
ncbi:MAG TPA: MBL fold metallo-hydrolase [Candidatus Angelobacter sp.]|nr:MBL fold metallo-hydrolase [Candidatus Angelobacter sp.]